MRDRDKIQAGDIVHVDFNVSQYTLCHKAKVLLVPQATGDLWVFRDVESDRLHYVSEGCTITLLEKSNDTR